MRTVLFITGTDDNLVIPCPSGRAVRVLGIFATVSGLAVGEQILATFSDIAGGTVYAATQSGPFDGNATQLAMGIGSQPNALVEDVVNVVSGAVTYKAAALAMTGPLPEITWQGQITVQISSQNVIVAAMLVAYESIGHGP